MELFSAWPTSQSGHRNCLNNKDLASSTARLAPHRRVVPRLVRRDNRNGQATNPIRVEGVRLDEPRRVLQFLRGYQLVRRMMNPPVPEDKSLRIAPAMAAGITDHVWTIAELLA